MEGLTYYEKVEKRIGDVFASIGRFISRHPWKVLVVTIFINLALGVGLINIKLLSDVPTVYMLSGTQAWKDEGTVRKIFPDLSRSNFQKLQLNTFGKWASVLIRSKRGNILESGTLAEISTLNDIARNITVVKDDGTVIGLSDICALTNGECNVDGSLFWSPEFLNAVENRNIPYPWFDTTNGVSDYRTFIGGQIDRNNTHVHSVEYVKVEYNLRTDGYPEKDITKWCNELIKVLMQYTSENLELMYAHSESMDEEFLDNVFGDLSLYIATAAVMVCYSLLATVSASLTNSVGQRMMLGGAGWLATGLAIISSHGLCAAMGVEFVSVVGVSSFLVSGIGIDDMFILLSGLSGAQTQTTISDKLAETMRVSGVGITITTITDLLAFGCGATSGFLGVKNFCIYTGVAVTFCYINNITIFGACITLNERRMKGNRHWLTCLPIKTKEAASRVGHSKSYLMCCTGKPPLSRDEAENLLDKFPRWILPKIVLYTPFKIVICVVFAVYMSFAIYGCVHMKQGLRFSDIPNDNSYFKGYAVTLDKVFPRQTPVSFVIQKYHDYSSQNMQNKIESFMDNVKKHKSFEDDFEVNWLKQYKGTPFYNNASEQSFIDGLNMFLKQSYGKPFQNDVVFDKSKSKILSSRIYVMSVDLVDSQEEGALMLLARNLAEESELECFAYYPSFIQFEQYTQILRQTMTSVGIAVVVVLVVTFIFMPHPVLIFFCTVTIAMIMTGVMGFMIYINRALSTITMAQIIVGIGFSVDFTAHICHGYMCSQGDTRAERVRGAIDKTGAPITHGAISSLLGVAMLGAASSYLFRTFAAVIAFVLGFGWAHALLFLPVILSWIGPKTSQLKGVRRSPSRSLPNNSVAKRLAISPDSIPEAVELVTFSEQEGDWETTNGTTGIEIDQHNKTNGHRTPNFQNGHRL